MAFVQVSGCIYLGDYTDDSTIDIGFLTGASVEEFLLAPFSSKNLEQFWNYNLPFYMANASVGYTNSSLSIENGRLNIQLPTADANVFTARDYGGNIYRDNIGKKIKIPCRVYYVGHISIIGE